VQQGDRRRPQGLERWHPGQAIGRAGLGEGPPEPVRDVVGGQRETIGSAEDQVVIGVVLAERLAFRPTVVVTTTTGATTTCSALSRD
jgi:hypothetical protein